MVVLAGEAVSALPGLPDGGTEQPGKRTATAGATPTWQHATAQRRWGPITAP